MEVIGSEQRLEDLSFFKLHWEEETARRWELQEVGTTRREELKIRLRLSPFSHRGAVDERTKTNGGVDAERSYLQAFEDSGVRGGNRSTGFDVLRTRSRKVATARQGQQVRTKTTVPPVKGELLTNDRRRTATTTPTPTPTTTAT